MPERNSRLLVDTNAITAAHQLGCWNALRSYCTLETAEFCIEEAVRADRRGRRLVSREAEELRAELQVHAVTDIHRAALLLQLRGKVDLDDGERDLLALALSLSQEAWWLCGPDKATLRAMSTLGLAERMVSLQEVSEQAGARGRQWQLQYTTAWLSTKRTQLLLGEELI